jgi:hypothetical protein
MSNNKMPGFYPIVTKGSITLVMQTTEHKAEIIFNNETVQILIDGNVIFETEQI